MMKERNSGYTLNKKIMTNEGSKTAMLSVGSQGYNFLNISRPALLFIKDKGFL